MFCLKNVPLKRPRSKKTSQTIINALDSELVPAILETCNVVGGRATFSSESSEDVVLQIAARRKEVERLLMEIPEVSDFLSFTCPLLPPLQYVQESSMQ